MHTTPKPIPMIFLIRTLIVFTLYTFQSSPIGWSQFGAFIWFYSILALDTFQQ